MELRHFPASATAAQVSAHLSEAGYAIVDGLASPELLDRFDKEVTPFVSSLTAGEDAYDGLFTKRTGALIARCPSARELVMNSLVLATVGKFLDHASSYQLLLTQLITIEPGETQQKLHRDQMMFDLYPFPVDYHVQCNTMWALSDFTKQNGATHLCPGSSALSDELGESIESVQAEMERGSVLFYEGKVLHGGGANTSAFPRQGINITYGVGWVRQEENQYLACPPEVARTLDDDLLRVMGYQQGAFSLGYVGDQGDPLATLRGADQRASRLDGFASTNEELRTFAADVDS